MAYKFDPCFANKMQKQLLLIRVFMTLIQQKVLLGTSSSHLIWMRLETGKLQGERTKKGVVAAQAHWLNSASLSRHRRLERQAMSERKCHILQGGSQLPGTLEKKIEYKLDYRQRNIYFCITA